LAFVISSEALQTDAALALITALNEELSVIYPEPGVKHFRLDPEEVAPGRGAFVIARMAGVPVGCGAIRVIGLARVELKRMYVDPSARGRGVGRRLVLALEERARQLGATRAMLETGTRQGEALALYERCGYRRVEPFGEYLGSPLSVCMAKDLC